MDDVYVLMDEETLAAIQGIERALERIATALEAHPEIKFALDVAKAERPPQRENSGTEPIGLLR